MQSYDAIVVGGGVGGSALAANLAQAGLSVEIVEREETYVDRVRGEWMAPWGVREAQNLGVYLQLISAGGHHVRRSAIYDELVPPEAADAGILDLSSWMPGIPGPLCMEHVAMQVALLSNAERVGVAVKRGISDLDVVAGPEPRVQFSHQVEVHTHFCRLLVGADGRSSTVRRKLGIELHESEVDHLISGLLVDGAEEWQDDLQVFGKAGAVMLLVFPQGRGKVRLYVDYGLEHRGKFTGEEGARRLLAAFNVPYVPGGKGLSEAHPIGPCHAYPSQYATVEKPYVEGAVLIGDAAGYTDPISGQGLSVTFRDARMVRDILLNHKEWNEQIFQSYGDARRELGRRISHVTRFAADLFVRNDYDSLAARARALQRLGEKPEFGAFVAATYIGAEQLPAEAFTDEFRTAIFTE